MNKTCAHTHSPQDSCGCFIYLGVSEVRSISLGYVEFKYLQASISWLNRTEWIHVNCGLLFKEKHGVVV